MIRRFVEGLMEGDESIRWETNDLLGDLMCIHIFEIHKRV